MPSLRVLIAGGGVAGLETALALHHMAGPRVEVELLAPRPDFIHRPASVRSPFDGAAAPRLPLEPLEQLGVGRRSAALASVDADRHEVRTTDGATLSYDRLVVATGARPREAVAGAVHFAGPLHAGRLEGLIRDVAEQPDPTLTFAAPHGLSWLLPLYELALLSAAALTARGVDASITVVTPERRPLELFGPAVSAAVARILGQAGIDVRLDDGGQAVFDGSLQLRSGAVLPPSQVVALPALDGPHVSGLPAGSAGFIPVDAHGRVAGVPDVLAAGDAADTPVEQGGLAAQQADACAELIAADAGADVVPRPATRVLRAILTTGEAPLFLRADPDTERSEVSGTPLWTPPSKIAGRFVAGFLAEGRFDQELVDIDAGSAANSMSDHA
jgi:sulfide:quinone oxidoreductase